MKKKSFCFLLLGVLCLFGLSACMGEDSAQEATMQEAVFEMEENATTGFTWEVSQEGSGSFEVEKEVIEQADSASEMLAGAGQMVRYTLLPKDAGEVHVHFVLARPWEGGETVYEATFVFEVTEDGTCTLISEEETVEDGASRPVFEGPIA